MRAPVLAGLLLAACAGQAGLSDPVSTPAQLLVTPETPLAEIPPQELAAGQCGLALWQRTEPARRILFVTNQPPAALIVAGGAVIVLPRTQTSGDSSFGHAPQQRFEAGGHVVAFAIKIEPREGLVGGAVIPDGSLTYRNAAFGTVILPVFGLIGCK